jgi:hypothetical protein
MHGETVHSPTHVRRLPTDIHPPTILARWTIFRQVIWTHSAALPTTQEIRAFNRHGLARSIGV